MPWKVSPVVSLRTIFVSRLKGGERMSDLCREYGISRKTGYKFLERFERFGPEGLFDASRRPIRMAHSTPEPVQRLILDLKNEKPTWGAAKLYEVLRNRHVGIRIPACSTIHEILKRHGLVKSRRSRRRSFVLGRTNLVTSAAPNDFWCADFKGQFRLGDRSLCYPLTISDHASRYVLRCEALEGTKGAPAQLVFEDAFREFGLPAALLTDNGAPFASHGLLGLSKLSVWFLRLGIQLARIEPGHPEQNGRHERMHRTLKAATTRPAGANQLQQQERFDGFLHEYNHERPHEALDMKTPASLYTASSRSYPDELPEPEYPLHDRHLRVTQEGKLQFRRNQFFYLSETLAGQRIGLREEDDDLWNLSFLNFNLGTFNSKAWQFSPAEALTLSEGE
jgi:transposase InsO family protein